MAKKKTSSTATSAEYGANQIRRLEGLEAVRMRPGMYIGGTDTRGLHVTVREIIDNAVDEALAGHCDEIIVTMTHDGVVSVQDNGRGIPVAQNDDGEHAVHLVFEDLHAGGKFGDGGYKVSGGLHGVGASVTNGLAEWLKVDIVRDGYRWTADWAQGIRVNGVKKNGKAPGSGTTVTWKYDATIFNSGVTWEVTTVERLLKDRSYLVSGVRFVLRAEGLEEQVFHNEEAGIKIYTEDIASSLDPVHKQALYFVDDAVVAPNGAGKDTEMGVEVALQWTATPAENLLAFANIIRNPGGGTHITGLKSALTRALNHFAYDQGKLKKDNGKKDPEKLESRDITAALTAIVSVKIPDPQFEGQTKDKLNNVEARTAVQSFLYRAFSDWLKDRKSQKDASEILERCLYARKVRLAQGRVQRNYTAANWWADAGNSSKHCACSGKTKPEDRELFLVEGDSAAGPAKAARDVTFQGIMPLRGKPINALTSKHDRLADNKEIQGIVAALGGRFDQVDEDGHLTLSLPPEKREYGTVILLADADADGAHITMLLLGMFWRLIPEYIREGRVFLARPPLYKIALDNRGEKKIYAYTAEERNALMKEHKRSGEHVGRFKGLGEMNADELAVTAMNPETRQLYQVRVGDMVTAEATFDLMLGTDGPRRKEWLESGDASHYLPETLVPDLITTSEA